MTPRIGIVSFPGSLDERDGARAVRLAGAEAVNLWHDEEDLRGVDALVIPGGFSYGDYLRPGAIARFAPVMRSVVDAAGSGMPVLGACNGFQILCEAELLPGALVVNSHQRFVRRDQTIRIENTGTVWTNEFRHGEEITLPLKSGDGNFVASEATLDRLEGDGHVVLRYLGVNPNGSMRNIAGIRNHGGNIVGLMPSPEHAVEPGYGPDGSLGPRAGTDGLRFFTSVITHFLQHA